MECINSNSQSDYLVKQFNRAMSSPVATAIYKDVPKKPDLNTEADSKLAAPCSDCLMAPLKIKTGNLEKFKEFFQNGTRINLSCAIAARKFSAATPEIMCPENVEVDSPELIPSKGLKREKRQGSGACVTIPMIAYQNLIYESMYRCIRSLRETEVAPFSLATIFEIVAQESTFKPNFSSQDGHGAGQLTALFVEDMQQSWRGYGLLKEIASSENPKCDAAKIIAKKDIARKVKISVPNDRCEFIQYGEGMERNALWMMVGMDTTWKKNMKRNFSPYLEKHKNHPDLPKVMEKLLQMSYGRAGYYGMYALYNKFKELPPNEFLRKINPTEQEKKDDPGFANLVGYLSELKDRQRNMASKIDPEHDFSEDKKLKSRFTKEGAAACIE